MKVDMVHSAGAHAAWDALNYKHFPDEPFSDPVALTKEDAFIAYKQREKRKVFTQQDIDSFNDGWRMGSITWHIQEFQYLTKHLDANSLEELAADLNVVLFKHFEKQQISDEDE